jgi:tetratricopeptide (TPR) repeat protein
MKAEHRKELETNVLADQMGKAIEGIKEGPTTTVWMILAGLVVALVLYLVWTMASTSAMNTNSRLWEEWSTLANASDLEAFVKEHGRTTQGRLARFRLARQDLGQGIAGLGNVAQRKESLGRVRKAAEAYEQLVGETASLPLLQQEALLNAGKAYETLGEVERAMSFYRRLTRDHPGTAAASDAEAALKRIEANPKDVDLLKRFVQEKPETDSLPAAP